MLIKRKSIEKEESQRRARPVRQASFAPVTLSEADGVRYLHFGTEWIQGAMRLRKPDWIELEYVQQMMAWMLFVENPGRIVQLGLGSAALTKFCYRQFPQAAVTAVELNPEVIAICDSMFRLPPEDERLSVLQMDAGVYIADPARRGSIDILQIDLYDASARGPVLDSPAFYGACAAALGPQGIATINLFGDHPSYARNLKAMRPCFEQVICLPELQDGNVIALAFKRAPQLDFAALYERAARIRESTRLPARSWVNGIKAWAQANQE